jgi:hypothetical protein
MVGEEAGHDAEDATAVPAGLPVMFVLSESRHRGA